MFSLYRVTNDLRMLQFEMESVGTNFGKKMQHGKLTDAKFVHAQYAN